MSTVHRFVTLDEFRSEAAKLLKGVRKEDPHAQKLLQMAPLTDTEGAALSLRKNLPSQVDKEATEKAGADRVLVFNISSKAEDRDGDTIEVDGWELGNFNKSGSVLWAHDPGQPPIAKPLATWTEGGFLKSRAEFTPKELYPFGHMVYEMFREGYIRGVSVGFKPLEWSFVEDRSDWAIDFHRQELLEYSATPVPSNPEAVVAAKSAGIDVTPLIEWAEGILDREKGSGLWLPRKQYEDLRSAAKDAASAQVPDDVSPKKEEESTSLESLAAQVHDLNARVDALSSPSPSDGDEEVVVELEDDDEPEVATAEEVRSVIAEVLPEIMGSIRKEVRNQVRRAAGYVD